MTVAPITLVLYNSQNEVVKTLSRSFLPWGILELAIDLQQDFASLETDEEGKVVGIETENIIKLTNFIIYIFGDQVTADEINKGASIEDMFAAYSQIFKMVGQIMKANPTIGQAVNRTKNLKMSAQ